METTNIYVLIDPRTNKIRYVGKANNVNQRYAAHLNRARKHQIHKKNWIEQLKHEGLKPIIEVIDIVPIEDWVFWETYWISQIKTWGFDLINYTSGGDGCTFANQTSFKKGQGGKKVVGYNIECEKIYEFNTASAASEYLKIHKSFIPKCCSFMCREKTVNKITWFYLNDINNLTQEELNCKIKERFTIINLPNSGSFKKGAESLKKQKVGMYTLNDELIKVFNSIGEAAKYIGVTNRAIQYACTKNKTNKCKNYKWKYEK
jgi:hypothetical protein